MAWNGSGGDSAAGICSRCQFCQLPGSELFFGAVSVRVAANATLNGIFTRNVPRNAFDCGRTRIPQSTSTTFAAAVSWRSERRDARASMTLYLSLQTAHPPIDESAAQSHPSWQLICRNFFSNSSTSPTAEPATACSDAVSSNSLKFRRH